MKINNRQGEQTNASAKKEALISLVTRWIIHLYSINLIYTSDVGQKYPKSNSFCFETKLLAADILFGTHAAGWRGPWCRSTTRVPDILMARSWRSPFLIGACLGVGCTWLLSYWASWWWLMSRSVPVTVRQLEQSWHIYGRWLITYTHTQDHNTVVQEYIAHLQ